METLKQPACTVGWEAQLSWRSATQLAFPGESNPDFPWKKSQWDNTAVKKKKKMTQTPVKVFWTALFDPNHNHVLSVEMVCMMAGVMSTKKPVIDLSQKSWQGDKMASLGYIPT